MKFKTYPDYKDSELPWIGKIPSHWEIKKIKHIFSISKEKSFEKNPDVLSLTQRGIIKRDISTNEGQLAESYEGYNKIRINDIVMNPMDLISGFVDCANIEGVISPAYTTLRSTKEISPDFFNFYFQKHYYEKIFFPFAEGVSTEHRWTLKNEDLLNFNIIRPSLNEQKLIASFLDSEIAKVERIIKNYIKLIELLNEKKIALISLLVTKGLDKKVEMKNSRVDWIGEIPIHWEVKKLKYVSNIIPGQSPSDETYNEEGHGAILINGPKEYSKSDFGYTRESKWTTDPKKMAPKESLLFCLRGSTTGRLNIAHTDISIGRGVAAIVSENNQYFMNYVMFGLRSYVLGTARGSTFPSVTTDDLGNYSIPYPNEKEQELIVKYLNLQIEKIDSLIQVINQQIILLKEYKISLISHAVTGKIEVRKENTNENIQKGSIKA